MQNKLKYYLAIMLMLSMYLSYSQGVELQYGFTDGRVNEITTDNDYVYKAGSFVRAFNASEETGHAALADTSGNLQTFPKVNNRIRKVISDGNGGWYIAGDFTQVGLQQKSRIAHVLSDGSVDTTFAPVISGNIYTVVIEGDSLLIGGQFTTVNGESRTRLAKLNKNDGQLGSWNPGIASGNVYDLTVENDSVYVVGTFSSVGSGLTRTKLAKTHITTGEFGAIAPTFNFDVNKVIVVGDSIIAGGAFTLVDGITRNRLVKMHKESGVMSDSWNPNADRIVSDILVEGDSIYAAGWFGRMSNQNIDALAKISIATGKVNSSFDINSGIIRGDIKRISSISQDENGNLYVGGYFQKIGTDFRSYIAKLNSDGELIESFNLGLSDRVNSLTFAGNKLLIGGDFFAAGGEERIGLARFSKATGELDDWESNANAAVNKLLIDGDSIMVGGYFTSIGGESRTGIARIAKSDGAVGNWDPSAGGIQDMIIDGDSLYIAGGFVTVNGSSKKFVAKIHKESGVLGNWDASTNGTVYDILLDGDSLFIGGSYTTIKGISQTRLAKVHKTTGELGPLDVEANSDIWALEVSGDSLFLGGRFTTIKGLSRQRLAKVNKYDGEPSATWIANVNNSVYDIVNDGDHILVGGWFALVNSTAADELVRLDQLTADRDANYLFTILGPVFDIHKDGDYLYAGGNFSQVKGTKKYCSVAFKLDNDINVQHGGFSQESGATLLFEDQMINTSSDAQTITVQNHSVSATIELDGAPVVSLTGTDADSFTLDTAFINKTLTPNTSTTFTVTFSPTTGGDKTAALEISNTSDNESNFIINLEAYAEKQDQEITFDALVSKTFGDTPFNLTATSDAGLTVSFESADTNIATISGDELTIVGAGEVEIAAYQEGDDFYNAADTVYQTLTVSKADQTITFADLDDKTFGDSSFDLTGTSDSGLDVEYSASNDLITIDGSTVTINGAGSVTITASQAGSDNYNTASNVEKTLNILKADQTITFNALDNKTFGEDAFDLTASSDSGLEIAYSSDDESVVSIDGNTVTVVGAGTANIFANQSGNDNYNAATEQTQSITIEKSTQTISFGSLGEVAIDEGTLTLSGTASSGLTLNYTSSDLDVATIDGDVVTLLTVGTIDITASQPGNDDYLPADDVIQTLVIKDGQTITFNEISEKSVTDDDFDLDATSTSGLTITYSISDESVATINGSTVSIVGAGTATITASQSGNDNYVAAADVTQQLVVNQLAQTITFGQLDEVTYGDSDFELTASASSGLEITYTSSDSDIATVSGNMVSIIGAGEVEITASQTGNDTYSEAADVTQTLTIYKKPQTISFESVSSKTFGDDSFELVASSSESLDVTYSSSDIDVLSIEGNVATINGAGSVTITASQVGNDNINAADDQTQSITIAKADPQLSFTVPSDKVYGDEAFELSTTSTSTGTISYSSADETVASINGNLLTIHSAGIVNISASVTSDENYTESTITSALTIGKLDQEITFELEETMAFTSSVVSLTGSTTSGLDLTYQSSDETVATIIDGQLQINGVGTTTITATQSGNSNFNAATSVSQTIEITKASQTIDFQEVGELTYGDDAISLVASATSGQAVTISSSDESVIRIEGNDAIVTGAGTVTLTATQSGSNNYESANASQTVVVSKASQSISFELSEEVTYSTELLQLEATASSQLEISYSVSDETIATISGSLLTMLQSGTVTITANQAGDSNYEEAAPIALQLTIKKASQEISFESLGGEYQVGDVIILTGTSTAGLEIVFESSDENVISISGNQATIVGTGEGTITASQNGNNQYEAATPVSQTLVIEGSVLSSKSELVKVMVYPNPASDFIQVDTDGEVVIAMYDQRGVLVKSPQKVSGPVDVRGLVAGIYLLHIQVHGQQIKKRIKIFR